MTLYFYYLHNVLYNLALLNEISINYSITTLQRDSAVTLEK